MRSYDDYWSSYVPVPAGKYMGIGTLSGMIPGGIIGSIAAGKGSKFGGGLLGAGLGGLAGLLIGGSIANIVDEARMNAVKNQMVADYLDEYPEVLEEASNRARLDITDYLTNVVGPAMITAGISKDPSWTMADAGLNMVNMPYVQQKKIRDNIYLRAFSEAKNVAKKERKK